MTERDRAVAIATKICKRLFERTWMPFNSTIERAIARLIDAIIAAAVEQVRAGDLEHELDELDDLTDERATTGDGLEQFREWQRRRGRVA